MTPSRPLPASAPGIAKVRRPHPHARRQAVLVRLDDAYWQGIFDRADIVSEGAVQVEGQHDVYRGSTSLLLDAQATSNVALSDPHLRLRALRIARREAQVRAPRPLGPMHADIVVKRLENAIRIDVEVDATLEAPYHRASNAEA